MIFSIITQLITIFLPWFIRGRILRNFLWRELHPSSRIGLSIILSAHVRMAEGSRIGHLNLFKGLILVEMGYCARVGNLNWIAGLTRKGSHFIDQTNRTSEFILGHHSSLTHRHIVDCTDTVKIGNFSTIAGWRSQILTHSIDVSMNRQLCAPVFIGNYSFVGTGCVILKGAQLPSFSILSAGSVLNKFHHDEYKLYCGNPAKAIKDIDHKAAYFERSVGYVN